MGPEPPEYAQTLRYRWEFPKIRGYLIWGVLIIRITNIGCYVVRVPYFRKPADPRARESEQKLFTSGAQPEIQIRNIKPQPYALNFLNP